jgi:hypothetical protein
VGKSPQHRRGIPQATAPASFNASSAGSADHHGRPHRHSATCLQDEEILLKVMRSLACGAARDAPADNYGRKLKPTAKKTGKIRQKTKKTLKNPEKKTCKNSK